MKNIEEVIAGMSLARIEKQTKVLYPRQELMKKFVDRINAERAGTKFHKLSPAYIATRMYQSGLNSDFLLNWFYGYCDDYKGGFGKCWFWALKAQK